MKGEFYSNFINNFNFSLRSVEEAFNPQNDLIWSAQRPEESERTVERRMKPKSVMLWAGVGFAAKAPLIFVESGIKIDTDGYRREILRPVKRWAMEHYGVDEKGKFLNSTLINQFIFRILE